MLSITKQTINSQKVELANFAFKKFNATFISIMNGKNRFLQRNEYGFSHIRFTSILEKKGSRYELRSKKDYKDYYFYITTSTSTDTKSQLSVKLEENLSDRCFNVRGEVLFAHSDGPTFFLIDYGEYWAYCSVEYARNHIIKVGEYEGREICTVRLAQGDFVKKEHVLNPALSDSLLSFDATFIQNVTYSKYRKRGGLLKVEVFKNNELQATKYYVSTGALKEDFDRHGKKYSQEYFRRLCKENKSIEVNGSIWVFSKVSEVKDISIDSSSSFTISSTSSPEVGLSLHSSVDNDDLNSFNTNKNVMINPPKGGSIESIINSGKEVLSFYQDLD